MAGGWFRVRGTALAGDTVLLWMLLLSVGYREFLRLHHAQSAEETSSSISCDSEVATSTFVHQSSGWERGRGRNRLFPFSHCYRRRTGLLFSIFMSRPVTPAHVWRNVWQRSMRRGVHAQGLTTSGLQHSSGQSMWTYSPAIMKAEIALRMICFVCFRLTNFGKFQLPLYRLCVEIKNNQQYWETLNINHKMFTGIKIFYTYANYEICAQRAVIITFVGYCNT